MKCLECGKEFSNDLVTCPNCGSTFGEEDLQVMLDLYKKEKKSKAGRELFVFIFAVAFFALLLYFGSDYAGRYAKEKTEEKYLAYIGQADEYFDSMEGLLDYAVDDSTAMVQMKEEDWDSYDDNRKVSFLLNVQTDLANLRKEAGLSFGGYCLVQVNNEEGIPVSYIDTDGNVTLEAEIPSGQNFDRQLSPVGDILP